jgi:predicted nucleic acid-binding protein
MSFLLDTNICSAHMRRPGGVAHRFIQHSGRLFMPTIVLAELYAGAYILDSPERILRGIHELQKDVGLLDFDEGCAGEFGKLRGTLKRLGIHRNPVDLMIAAVALSRDLTLVTHNTQHFTDIPGLRLEDWLA